MAYNKNACKTLTLYAVFIGVIIYHIILINYIYNYRKNEAQKPVFCTVYDIEKSIVKPGAEIMHVLTEEVLRAPRHNDGLQIYYKSYDGESNTFADAYDTYYERDDVMDIVRQNKTVISCYSFSTIIGDSSSHGKKYITYMDHKNLVDYYWNKVVTWIIIASIADFAWTFIGVLAVGLHLRSQINRLSIINRASYEVLGE